MPGDGGSKCVEYLDACAREAAVRGGEQGEQARAHVVLYGGADAATADLSSSRGGGRGAGGAVSRRRGGTAAGGEAGEAVGSAQARPVDLSSAVGRPVDVFGPRLAAMSALADALCARVARKNDEEDPTLERRQVALDFATLAVAAASGGDYLPPLSVASHAACGTPTRPRTERCTTKSEKWIRSPRQAHWRIDTTPGRGTAKNGDASRHGRS